MVARLAEFVGDACLVGHNVSFDLAFLAACGYPPATGVLDTAELASCLFPTASSYALQRLLVALAVPVARAHRALDDAEACALLCGALARRARELRLETLEAALPLAALMGEGVEWFFREALAAKARERFVDVTTGDVGGAAPKPSLRGEEPRAGTAAAGLTEATSPAGALGAASPAALDPPLAEVFSADGPLALAFERYEGRPQQLAMAQVVERAIVDGGALLVEAGTGTGKSLAYLVPALRAIGRGQRVIVSTYTTALQDQLVRKDVPQAVAALGVDADVAVLKGRSNYVCPRRWHLLRLHATTREEARVALKTLVWREGTATGDRAELHLAGPEQALWERVCAEDETCTTRRCALVRGGCYLERAREAAERADLVVVNHALLLADARARGRLLPRAPIVVVDEAHHVEEVAAATWAARVEAAALRTALRRAAHGPLVAALARQADDDVVATLRAEAERAMAATDETFAALARLMPPPEERGFEDRRRVTDALRGSEEWLAVELAGERLRDSLAGVIRAAETLLTRAFDGETADAAADLEAATEALRGAEAAIGRAVHSRRAGDVCWVALEGDDAQPVLRAAPAHAGALVDRYVVAPRTAAIFTSATLAIGESFDFAADRLGLGDRAATLRLDSPFDYRRQALLVLPSGLLDPYDPAFVDQAADVIAEVGRALGGRTLALFTAHTMLRAVYARLPGRLDGTAVVALAQGTGASRRTLLERFAQGEAVLLGTASFWEGVDLPGELLRCVIVVKLPFPVPDDPVVAGRAERYEDPFREYHVPIAALRLKQGFGRLIRTADDRGAVVLLDRRISLRAYGDVLLSALPTCTVARPEVDALGAVVAAWCGN